MHYLLIYDVVDDYVRRRQPFRAAHLAHAQHLGAQAEVAMQALTDPVDQAVLLFQADSPAVPEAFAAADPYVREGLIARVRVRPWLTVAGPLASQPLSPADVPD